MQTLVYLVDALGMLALGPSAAALLRRRTGVGWGAFGFGAVTFVASQVVHLPLNGGVALALRAGWLPRPPDSWDPVLLPLALGASAGLCEETARYVAMRRAAWIERPAGAAMFGFGHGGIESAILGLVVLLALFQMLALRDPVAAAQAGLPPGTVEAFFGAPPGLVLLGLLERVFAVTLHVACSLLVARAVLVRAVRFWAAAFLLHAGIDAAAVAAAPRLSPVATEGVVGVFAALSLAVAVALWRTWPVPPPPPPPPPRPPPTLAERPLDPRDADDVAVL